MDDDKVVCDARKGSDIIIFEAVKFSNRGATLE
jgi:hypothetical protein